MIKNPMVLLNRILDTPEPRVIGTCEGCGRKCWTLKKQLNSLTMYLLN